MSTSSSGGEVVRLHRRQFVIGPRPYLPFDSWRSEPIHGDLYLSHCPELRLVWGHDADGNRWALLGLAIQTLEDESDPVASIAFLHGRDVLGSYASWAGRWVLVGRDELHLDATGLLGCYYGTDASADVWATSSPALIGPLVGAEEYSDSRTLRYESGVSWFPPPQSRFDRARRLLPSQVLDLTTGSVRPRPLVPELSRRLGFEEAVDRLAEALATALERVYELCEETWLGLTAGADSRLMLAIASAHGVPVRPYTRISPRMSAADLMMPPQLAESVGYDHRYVYAPVRPPDRWHYVQDHAAEHVSRGDAAPLLRGERDRLTGVSLGGHGFSLAKGFADWRRLPPTLPDPQSGARLLGDFLGEPADSAALIGIRDWLTWVHETPDDQLDWRDRLFMEQRQAGWLSAKEQLYDLLPLERFPILNASSNHSVLLGIPERERLGERIPNALVGRFAPGLLEYPINPPDRHYVLLRPGHVFRRSALRLWRRVAARARRSIGAL